MAFAVTNLGVVKQGTLTQQPLTVLCGPNNNGKTWVMYCLYYYHKLIAGLGENKRDKPFDDIPGDTLTDPSKITEIINRDLADVFNTSRDLLKNASFVPQLSAEQLTDQIQNIRKTFLMPAERAGLHLFYRELGTRRTALLHHASRENIDLRELLRDVIHSRYAMPIADYINWLNQLSENQRNSQGIFHGYGEFLKKKLVRGTYTVSPRMDDITFKPYQRKRDGNRTRSMSLHMTSSTVKSLFGLWFYLEKQAKAGDLLMIDEPELNLHPKNQRIIARLLAKLVNAGLNVVISTHSDYIVREFNSLIMLNDKRVQNLREKHGYQEDEVLDSTKVGAYLFDNQTIKPFKVSPDDGIYATTFDEVIRELNQVNDDIYYSLQESSDEQ
ncbi:hypothetical protein BO98_01610 [Candidatus Synechococcus spongiarum LMB bulk10D]|nr:hypothetical protein BO98_01610 [Candidatus Synechococcus spongiarum LMB bulk10D]